MQRFILALWLTVIIDPYADLDWVDLNAPQVYYIDEESEDDIVVLSPEPDKRQENEQHIKQQVLELFPWMR